MRLFWKFFLLQLLAITAVLAGVVATTRAYSVRGFAEFVEKREVERITLIAERLGDAYEHSFDLGEAWDELPARQRMERNLPPPPPEEEQVTEDGRHVVVRRHVVRAPL